MPAANSNTPPLAELIAEHWARPTDELCTIIARHHPTATTAEIVAELRRQAEANFAEANFAEADALAIAGPAEGLA